jgi:hypothetical protein
LFIALLAEAPVSRDRTYGVPPQLFFAFVLPRAPSTADFKQGTAHGLIF